MRFTDLADERTRARLTEKWTRGRLVDLENGRVNLQFENRREVLFGVNLGQKRPGPRMSVRPFLV